MSTNSKRLTDEQLGAMAGDVRRNGAAAALRHFFPLMHHLTEVEGYACDSCALWVPYGSWDAGRGECCRALQANSPIKARAASGVQDPLAIITAFDFRCSEWNPKPVRKIVNDAKFGE